MRRRRVKYLCVLGLAAATALNCSKGERPRVEDSARDTSQVRATPPASSSNWVDELGQLLVVPSDSENNAVVLYPPNADARFLASSPITLVSAAGDTTHAMLVASDLQQCADATVLDVSGGSLAGWSIGLRGSSGQLLRMDSIEALPSADSARLAADLARLASGLGTHPNSRFTGLPFAVIAAHRFIADGRQFVMAHLARRLNQEAAPLEERTLVIAERPAGDTSERFSVTYSARSEGTEDTAQHFDVLAAIHGRNSLFLVIARDQLSQTAYEILERSAEGRWRSRWSRALLC